MNGPAAGWSALHHGIDPDGVPLLTGWLRLCWALARPLVRLRVAPGVVTVAGVVFAVDALLFAAARPWAALGLIGASVLCDGLDGAVAVLAARATALGSLADKAADRVSDCAFAAVLWRCGAPWWLAALAGGISLTHEGFREIRGGALRTRITAGERPTRAVCAVVACGCLGLGLGSWTATGCAAVWVGAGVVGLGKLVRAERETARP